MPTTLSRSALSLTLVAALAGCGTTVVPAPSFTLRVRTVSPPAAPAVLLDAVDQLEVVVRPTAPARFTELPPGCSFDDCGGIQCCKYEDGAVATFIDATHAYVIRYDGAWVRSHAQVTSAGFMVSLPVFATSQADSPGAYDPTAYGTVLHGADRIGIGAITLPWPLRGGVEQDFPIMFAAGFELECANMDPSLPLDGGP